jgi:Pin2-interacting protein X1
LGAKDASHAEHYTAASASHIRVLLKDDNLGLGAKRGSERAENFGLAGLESILGRLNGREADVKKEEARREVIERRGFIAQKYGYMNFVSGGFLVGDKIEKGIKRLPKAAMEVKEEVKVEIKEEESGAEQSKKRKRSRDPDRDEPKTADEQPSLKRKKKSMNLREEAEKSGKSRKKSKKEKKSKGASTSESPIPGSEDPLSEKARRKAEKRARKEEKKLKKALKKAAKESARSSKSAPESSDDSSSSEEETPAPTSVSLPTSGTSTPGAMFGSGARHAVRQRYIRQKKMASMDPQALKEVSVNHRSITN